MTFDNKACEFGYRDSIFKRELKNKAVICSVVFRLSRTPKLRLDYGGIRQEIADREITDPTLKDIAGIVAGIRRAKLPDPEVLGNAGSFFKNPLLNEPELQVLLRSHPKAIYHRQGDNFKISAGWLIEQAGWKGYRFGDAGCYDKQALILVNYGCATGRDILALAEEIRSSVFEKLVSPWSRRLTFSDGRRLLGWRGCLFCHLAGVPPAIWRGCLTRQAGIGPP